MVAPTTFKVSDYSFGIFKFFLTKCQQLAMHLVSSNFLDKMSTIGYAYDVMMSFVWHLYMVWINNMMTVWFQPLRPMLEFSSLKTPDIKNIYSRMIISWIMFLLLLIKVKYMSSSSLKVTFNHLMYIYFFLTGCLVIILILLCPHTKTCIEIRRTRLNWTDEVRTCK
jgi:hypothetical protein